MGKQNPKNPKTVSQYELLRMLKEGNSDAEEELRRRLTLLENKCKKESESSRSNSTGT
ncbi:MAG: hypothetical protein J7J68_09250 [Thermotogaceae bacterium]|nr:hypothetical protein [Thermotogaceae bacterium]